MALPKHVRRQQSPTIAIIQSDPEIILLLQKALRGKQDRPVEVLKDGEQALAYFSGAGEYGDRSRHPLPSTIVCDLNLPGSSGFEILAWLREQPLLATVPAFVLTSSRQPQDLQRAYALGARAYFVKPLSPDVLATLLESIAGAEESTLEPLPAAEVRLKRIVVGSSSESSHISALREYKVRIGPRWYEGRFSKRWFGWLFEDFGDTGLQLNLIDEVFEVVTPRKRIPRRALPG